MHSTLQGLEAQVLGLQECGIPWGRKYGYLEKRWEVGPSWWGGSNENRAAGVGFLMRERGLKIKGQQILEEGRLQKAVVEVEGVEVTLYNVYAPAERTERVRFFRKMGMCVGGGGPRIVMGDFNCILEEGGRVGVGEGVGMDSTGKWLRGWIQDEGLQDIWAGTGVFTRVDPGGRSQSRIDFVLVSEGLAIRGKRLIDVSFSDHRVLWVEVGIGQGLKQGRGVWKLNVSLLEDPEECMAFQRAYRQWQSLQPLFPTRWDWWAEIKQRVREWFTAVGRKRAWQRKKELVRLQGEVQRLWEERKKGAAVQGEWERAREGVKNWFRTRMQERMFLAKAEWVEEGEEWGKFFALRVRRKKRVMGAARTAEGGRVEAVDGVLREVTRFYGDLFRRKAGRREDLEGLVGSLEAKVGEDGRQGLIKELTETEMLGVLRTMPLKKTPGGDGIPVEFYGKFWELVKGDLLALFKEMMDRGRVGEGFAQGVVVLIYKKGGREDIKNWRPITLLNSDYKLFSKILATRLGEVLPQVLGGEEMCVVGGRRTTHTHWLLRDTLSYIIDRKWNTIVASLDLQKAYDSIGHEFLFGVLAGMGMPGEFVGWLRALYGRATSRVLVRGFLGEAFAVDSGVRQGCPLSPGLFVCAIEPLAQRIRRDRVISGVRVPRGGELKVLLYMDDVTCVVRDEVSLERVVKHATEFGEVSGARVNTDKSVVLAVGNWGDLGKFGLRVEREELKILGVWMDSHGKGKRAWEVLEGRVNQTVGLWSTRHFSARGKVQVIKQCLLPKILYTAMVYPPSWLQARRVQRALCLFFWGGKTEKVARTELYKEEGLGGWALPNIEVFVYVHFLKMVVREARGAAGPVSNLCVFWAGRLLQRLGLFGSGWRGAWAWRMSLPYARLGSFVAREGLAGLGMEGLADARKVLKFLRGKQRMADVGELSTDKVRRVWRGLVGKEWKGEHEELAWRAVRNALPVRQVLYRWGLSRSPKCPRELCDEPESAEHVLWGCFYAQKVWGRAAVFLKETGRATGITSENVLYGLTEGTDGSWGVRVLVTCIKVALWKVRSLLALKGSCFSTVECLQLAMHELYFYRGGGKQSTQGGDTTPWEGLDFRGLFQPRVGIG